MYEGVKIISGGGGGAKGRPEGRIFFATGKRFHIFFQSVHMHKEGSHVYGQCSVSDVRGVAGKRPFKNP